VGKISNQMWKRRRTETADRPAWMEVGQRIGRAIQERSRRREQQEKDAQATKEKVIPEVRELAEAN
jgi:hypothetical protein